MEENLLDTLLPEEIFLHIFTFLNEKDIRKCASVCKKWRRISHDKKLSGFYVMKKLNKGKDPTKVFLKCCFKGLNESVDLMINLFITSKIKPSCSYNFLWGKGLYLAAKGGGHLYIMQKMILYGATNVFAEKALHAIKNDYPKAVQLILDNFKFSFRVIESIFDRNKEYV